MVWNKTYLHLWRQSLSPLASGGCSWHVARSCSYGVCLSQGYVSFVNVTLLWGMYEIINIDSTYFPLWKITWSYLWLSTPVVGILKSSENTFIHLIRYSLLHPRANPTVRLILVQNPLHAGSTLATIPCHIIQLYCPHKVVTLLSFFSKGNLSDSKLWKIMWAE